MRGFSLRGSSRRRRSPGNGLHRSGRIPHDGGPSDQFPNGDLLVGQARKPTTRPFRRCHDAISRVRLPFPRHGSHHDGDGSRRSARNEKPVVQSSACHAFAPKKGCSTARRARAKPVPPNQTDLRPAPPVLSARACESRKAWPGTGHEETNHTVPVAPHSHSSAGPECADPSC